MEDEEIVALYFAREERAIEATGEKYGAPLTRLAGRLLRLKEDAEECVNDTYLGAWNAIPPTRPQKLFAFLARICRNLACDRLDFRNAKKRSAEIVPLTEELAACLPDGRAGDAFDEEALGKVLNDFLENLPKESRLIFMRRYWFLDPVKEIAARYGIGESRVKTSLFRTRKKLLERLSEEDISL